MTPFRATALACGVAVVALYGFAASLQARTVRNDPGGVVSDRLIYVVGNWYEEVRVVGFCASACTLYIGMPNACTTRQAHWLFHGASGSSYERNTAWNETVARMYPEPLRTAFLTDYRYRETAIRGAELIRLGVIRDCDILKKEKV